MAQWSMRSVRALVRRSALSVLVVACLALAGGCASPEPSGSGAPGQGTTQSAGPPQPDATPSPGVHELDIFYLVGWGTDLRLVPEAHQVRTDAGAEARVFAAVSEMLGVRASDPDFSSGWTGTRLLSVQVAPDLLTIDVSQDARAASWTTQAAFAVAQEMIHTATAAAESNAPVALLVDGAPAGLMWDEVDWSEPLSRAPAGEILLLVRIESPEEGGVVNRSFQVTGSAAADSPLTWSVLTREGAVVTTGLATTGGGDELSPFGFTIQLPDNVPPGRYVLVVTRDTQSDPMAEPGPMRDDKQIQIR